MKNNKISKEYLTRLMGYYQDKYGVNFDEWSATVFNELEENFGNFSENFNKMTHELSNVIHKFKGKFITLKFTNWREAFGFGFGLFFPISILGITASVLTFVYKSNAQEYEDKMALIRDYKNIEKFKLVAKNGEIIEEDGQLYLVLKKRNQNNRDILIGVNYKEQKAKGRILILLGRK